MERGIAAFVICASLIRQFVDAELISSRTAAGIGAAVAGAACFGAALAGAAAAGFVGVVAGA